MNVSKDQSKTVTIARGDGIGPEIMDVSVKILEALKAPLSFDEIEIGERVYLRGFSSGIEDSSWKTLLKNKVFFKAPITTPQGGGFKSLNVTIRKTLGLFANVRPCQSYSPFVLTKHPKIDVVIVRENEEDLYAGIEHRQTQDVYQCLKLVSHQGCERIIRYAFEYARSMGRKKVSCFSKDNIMKMTDGLFHKLFDEIGAEYPDIEKDHWIIDIGTARLADTPEIFDVIVTLNLYGDIISDVAAQLTGSVGLGGSANIGETCAMFEAIHGSAPPIAGQNIANPSGLILASVQMLGHLGFGHLGAVLQNAWLKTLEDGVHTFDLFKEGISKKRVSTVDFGQAVIANLGESPKQLKAMSFDSSTAKPVEVKLKPKKKQQKKRVGVDVFVCWEKGASGSNEALAEKLKAASKATGFDLALITNRGVKVWPAGFEETFCTDHWRCRFSTESETNEIWNLLKALQDSGVEVIKTENLYTFDEQLGYSLGQGQ